MEYKNKQVWSDEPNVADTYRRAYVEGIESYIKRKKEESQKERDAFLSPDNLFRRQEDIRNEYLKMLGIHRSSDAPKVIKEKVGEDDFSYIYRMTVFVEGDVPFYAMLLMPKTSKSKVPLIVFQHGGGGTPELAADFYGKNNYNKAVRRFCERECAVILPQTLLWARKGAETCREHPIDFNREKLDNEFKRLGMTITGFEINAIIRCIDYAVTLDEIDTDRIGMAGLSYGGYFTLYTMAADTRIKVGYAVGAFNDRNAYPRYDWSYYNSANRFHDAEVAALCAPRRLVVEIGKVDPVFDYKTALPEVDRARKYFEVFGASENFKFNLHEGGHTFTDTDEYFEFVIDSLK